MKANPICCALPLALLLASTTASADYVFLDEDFSGSTVPAGWIFNGISGGSHTNPAQGTVKTATNWFGNNQGFVRLTSRSPGSQRTTAIYGGATFSTKDDFSIAAEVRINSNTGTGGADGISFFWLDAASLDLDTYDLSHYQGGLGEWQGSPRGTVITSGVTPATSATNYGAYNSTTGFISTKYGNTLHGYSFEFDHYRNTALEQQEYNHMVRLDEWRHMTGMNVNSTADPYYYEDVGWVSFELVYSAQSRSFTYTYTGRNPTTGQPVAPKTVTMTPTADQWSEFDLAYFGISAGTGGEVADHDVRNLVVTAAPIPGTLWLLALAVPAIVVSRRRQSPGCVVPRGDC